MDILEQFSTLIAIVIGEKFHPAILSICTDLLDLIKNNSVKRQ